MNFFSKQTKNENVSKDPVMDPVKEVKTEDVEIKPTQTEPQPTMEQLLNSILVSLLTKNQQPINQHTPAVETEDAEVKSPQPQPTMDQMLNSLLASEWAKHEQSIYQELQHLAKSLSVKSK